MAYKVEITPGKGFIKPEDLDEDLKRSCDAVVLYDSNIYVCGRHGVGKSAVLRYFEYKAEEYFGANGSEVLMMTAHQFTENVIAAIRSGSIEEMREKLDSVKVVIIDDVDFLEGKDATQTELMRLLEPDRRIILSGTQCVYNLRLNEYMNSKLQFFTEMEISEV